MRQRMLTSREANEGGCRSRDPSTGPSAIDQGLACLNARFSVVFAVPGPGESHLMPLERAMSWGGPQRMVRRQADRRPLI
jgi:hypothetical protein